MKERGSVCAHLCPRMDTIRLDANATRTEFLCESKAAKNLNSNWIRFQRKQGERNYDTNITSTGRRYTRETMADGGNNSNDPCLVENLICYNGSFCKQGKPNIPHIHRPLGLQTHVTSKTDGNHYHCKCPDGYIGHDCSVKVTECAATRDDLVHHCYYGSQCVKADNDSGLLDRYCDCSSANADREEFFVTGLMCQYKSTQLCVDDAFNGGIADQFCANGGKCNDMVSLLSSHPGCNCHHKWEGDHCQFKKGILFDDALDLFQQRQTEIASQRTRYADVVVATNSVAHEEGSKLYILYIVSGCFVAAATIFFFVSRSRRKREERPISNDVHFLNEHLGFESIVNSSNVNLSPRGDSLDEVDPWNTYDQGASSYAPMACSNNLDLVETLDDDTSRMIEARLDMSTRSSKQYHDDENEINDEFQEEDNNVLISQITINSDYLVECPPSDCMSTCSNSYVQSLDGDAFGTDGTREMI